MSQALGHFYDGTFCVKQKPDLDACYCMTSKISTLLPLSALHFLLWAGGSTCEQGIKQSKKCKANNAITESTVYLKQLIEYKFTTLDFVQYFHFGTL